MKKSKAVVLGAMFLYSACFCALPTQADVANSSVSDPALKSSSESLDPSLDFLKNGGVPLRKLQITLHQAESISTAYVRSRLNFKEGDEVSLKEIQLSTKQLYESGWVENCRWHATPIDEKSFDLALDLDVCPKVSGFKFYGINFFSENTLIAEMKTRIHQPVNVRQLMADRIRLLELYRSKGFFDVQISMGTRTTQPGYQEIGISIKEYVRRKICGVFFEGVKAFKPDQLRSLLQTKSWSLLSIFNKSGRIEEKKLQQDIETLRNFYINAGYLDVVIDRNKIRLVKNEKAKTINEDHWRVCFCIQEGPCYRIRNVLISSDQEKDKEVLRQVISLKPGDAASPEKIEASCEIIREFYGYKGYIAADIDAKRTYVGDHQLDVHFTVKRNQQYRIHSIYLTGNYYSQSRVILRELNLAPGDVFNLYRMKRAEARLQNTGFFQSVLLKPEDCDRPGEKDLKIAVEERKTGSISFTGTLDKVNKFVFGVALGQNNFDYKNSKSYFRGAGQKFQVGTSIGKYMRSVELSFEEPWLYDRELRFGFNTFCSISKLEGNKRYKQRRIGIEPYLSKRLFEQVVGKLYYHIEHFKMIGVNEKTEAQAVVDEQGGRVISKIGFLMERDTRDQFIHPTTGTYMSWDNQVAGLGGATKYFRTRASAAGWLLVCPKFEQVFMVGGRVGYVKGWHGRQVPLFEREYLGGPDDLRGFDYREVGPKAFDKLDTNLGGKAFWFVKSEYSVKLHNIFRVIGFFDIGSLTKISDKYVAPKSGGTNADAGFGFRIDALGSPLRLDFAFPVKTDAYNRKKAPYISYSFGTSF